MTINRSQAVVWLSVALLSISLLDSVFDGIRYTKYLIIFLPLLFLSWEVKIYARKRSYLWPFIFIVLLGIVNLFRINQYGFYDLLFLLSSFIIFLFVDDEVELDVKAIFLCIIFFFTLYSTINFKSVSFSIINSSSPVESIFSFVFGLFFVYFFHTKEKAFATLAFFLTLIALKRIAIIGCLVIIIINKTPLLKEIACKNKFQILVIANVLLLAIVMLFSAGYIDDVIESVTGQDVTFVTMGRNIILENVVHSYLGDIGAFIFGSGPGSSYLLAAENFNLSEKINLHSDLLKIAVELGFLAFVIFFMLFYRAKNWLSINMALYLNVLLLTDNVISYTFVMFFYFLLNHVASQNRKKQL